MSDEHECHCYDPRDLTRKLWLCGSELCKAISNKAYRNGKINGEDVVMSEEETDT